MLSGYIVIALIEVVLYDLGNWLVVVIPVQTRVKFYHPPLGRRLTSGRVSSLCWENDSLIWLLDAIEVV